MVRWKSFLSITLVFICGIIIGVLGDRQVLKHYVQGVLGSDFETRTELVTKTLADQLSLDSEQRMKMRQVVTDTHKELLSKYSQLVPEVDGIIRDGAAKAKPFLNEEQQAEFNRWVADLKYLRLVPVKQLKERSAKLH